MSGSGDFVYAVALVAYVLNRTGSAAWVGGAIAFRLLPAVVFGPLAGVMASRFDRRRLMITLDLVRAVVMGALSVAAGLNHRYGSA